jgi:hypothetical protein
MLLVDVGIARLDSAFLGRSHGLWRVGKLLMSTPIIDLKFRRRTEIGQFLTFVKPIKLPFDRLLHSESRRTA